jgi:hypothetical protein
MREDGALKLFKIGDLVQYTSFYDDPIGPWKMFGDLGIVVSVRIIEDKYQVVKVRWFSDNSEIDMAPECLIKLNEPPPAM